MEHNRDFKGIWIPKEIWADKKLSIIEKVLLAEINSLDNEKGCFASNGYFADLFSRSETMICIYISKLKKLGYIREESFDGRVRILRSNRETYNLPLEFSRGMPLENSRGILYNKEEYNKEYSLSKDKEEYSDSPSRKSPLIDFWNKLSNTQKHKDTSTKIYKKSHISLNKLRKGIFFKKIYLNPDFIKKHNIDSHILEKKWSGEEIKQIMVYMNQALKEGGCSWVKNVHKLPKSIPDFLYNIKQGTSFFLLFSQKPPIPFSKVKTKSRINYTKLPIIELDEVRQPLVKEEYFLKMKNIFSHVFSNTTNDLQNKQIDNILEEFIFYHSEEIPRYKWNGEQEQKINYHLGYEGLPLDFLKEYAKYIQENIPETYRTPRSLQLNSDNFRKFLHSFCSLKNINITTLKSKNNVGKN